ANRLSRPPRRPPRAADRYSGRRRPGTCRLVGKRLRTASRGGIRRRDARCARRLPAVRQGEPARVAVEPERREAALPGYGVGLMEPRGLEPLTFWLPARRSPS